MNEAASLYHLSKKGINFFFILPPRVCGAHHHHHSPQHTTTTHASSNTTTHDSFELAFLSTPLPQRNKAAHTHTHTKRGYNTRRIHNVQHNSVKNTTCATATSSSLSQCDKVRRTSKDTTDRRDSAGDVVVYLLQYLPR